MERGGLQAAAALRAISSVGSERRLDRAEVTGSSPVLLTKKDNPKRLSFFISPNVLDERSYKIVSSASTTKRRIASTCLRSFPTYLSR